jgi:aminoglycoside phosphotransferase (APT) family kinase protein
MSRPSDSALDGASDVRPGEELDLGRLRDFLGSVFGRTIHRLEVRQFPRGFSNLTYLVQADDRELVLRRPPVGSKVKTAHDMGREHTILSRLLPVYPLVPRPVAYCDDSEVLGAPFYLMERVPGVILRAPLPTGLVLDAGTNRGICLALVDNLARLHAVDVDAAGLADFGRPAGYVGRQVRGWSERYRAAQTDPIADLDGVIAWLPGRVPDSDPWRVALVHNDYKHDNLVLDPDDLTRIRAVLDWEMATVGDPYLDLGTTLGYWVEAGDPELLRRFAFGPTALPGCLTRAEVMARYAEATGREAPDPAFLYAFGLVKIAVIAQQIYLRYRQGLTRDPRFSALLPAIKALAAQAAKVASDEVV